MCPLACAFIKFHANIETPSLCLLENHSADAEDQCYVENFLKGDHPYEQAVKFLRGTISVQCIAEAGLKVAVNDESVSAIYE
jgi:hypothetical protein